MHSYKIKRFDCPSRGISQIVGQLQSIPKNYIGAPLKLGAVPDIEAALNRCIKLIDRIAAISDDSPAGSYKEEARDIGFDVYLHLQNSGLMSWGHVSHRKGNEVSVETVGEQS